MADGDDVSISASGKTTFFCCKTKVISSVFCVKCDKVFHRSCVRRDWSEKVKFIDNSRVICLEHVDINDATSTKAPEKDTEIAYLKVLVDELRSRNQVLQENNFLLKEKIACLEKSPVKCTFAGVNKTRKTTVKLATPLSKTTIKLANTSLKLATPSPHKDKEASSLWTVDASSPVATPVNVNANPEAKGKGQNQNIKETTGQLHKETTDCLSPEPGKVEGEQDPTTAPEPASSNSEWKLVERRRNQTRLDCRPAPNRGTKQQTTLKIAEQFEWLFISGFELDTNPKQILKYVKDDGGIQQQCYCEKMATRNKLKSSFKLGVPKSVSHQVGLGSFWPEGAYVNNFLILQSRPRTRSQAKKTRFGMVRKVQMG